MLFCSTTVLSPNCNNCYKTLLPFWSETVAERVCCDFFKLEKSKLKQFFFQFDNLEVVTLQNLDRRRKSFKSERLNFKPNFNLE